MRLLLWMSPVLLLIGLCENIQAQDIPLPETMGSHPRVLIKASEKEKLLYKIQHDSLFRQVYRQLVQDIEPYVDRHQVDSTWVVSRLQMYWKNHYTQVYINGGQYSHAEGKAPVPTVRFTGTRDNTTNYKRPRLEDVKPFQDDERGLYLQSKNSGRWEYVEQSKTGRIIESINREIIDLAQKSAFLFWLSGDSKYAKFSTDIFDTYLTGIYYLQEPVDISHGHHQTLVGFSSFEVIHEDILNELTATYDFIYFYLAGNHRGKLPLYATAFKKWADLIIKNGVTFNNWNLHQARFISKIALILEDDTFYDDKRGGQYYLNQVFNHSSVRQWSLSKLMNAGYDQHTGIWNESPGYAKGMVTDFLYFVELYDRQFGIDLLPYFPVLEKASLALLQYQFPNGYSVGFGDGYYSKIPSESMRMLIANAQHFKKREQERIFTACYKYLNSQANAPRLSRSWLRLFEDAAVSIADDIAPGKAEDFLAPVFYAPNVSWIVQRNGTGRTGLMISQAGSLGNHCHANGIAMELYGQGLPMAPEMGIGTSYFQPDYHEYYARFPAHNTVVVDGKSDYPEMKSNHAFTVNSCYPFPSTATGYHPFITYTDVSFLEPETYADQRRVMGIIRTGDTTGYYIDIFRSKKKRGGDIRHDYFYHNLGQQLEIFDNKKSPLPMQPTDKLAFADGDLMAYDYLWDKKAVTWSGDINGKFSYEVLDGYKNMNFWIRGDRDREIFSVKAPPSKAFRGGGLIPGEDEKLPIPTLVVRQKGEAWTRPFVALYEPVSGDYSHIQDVAFFSSSTKEFVGVHVKTTVDGEDFIFSSADDQAVNHYQDKMFTGSYGVISLEKDNVTSLFLGNGTAIGCGSRKLQAQHPQTTALYVERRDAIHFSSTHPIQLQLDDVNVGKKVKLKLERTAQEIVGKRHKAGNRKVIVFDMPACQYTAVEMISMD